MQRLWMPYDGHDGCAAFERIHADARDPQRRAPSARVTRQPPSENIARSARAEYAGLARSYEARWKRYLEVSNTRTLAALAPRDRERILDAGCGTGLLLRRIATRAPGTQLVGVDLTLAMLRRAGRSASDLVLGDVRRLPFADGSLDAVVLASVLQYLPDLDAALSEAARVLKPGGRVVITLWDGASLRMHMLACWLRWLGRAAVQLHTLDEIVAACQTHRLSVRREQRYAAGRLWRLATIMGVKGAASYGPRTVD